jgi:cytochrome b6-f complex iron-sulfur subunit
MIARAMADPATEVRPSRRSFVNWFLGTSLGAVAVSILYPIFRYVLPPASGAAATSRVLAARRSELPPNSGKIFRFGARPGIVIDTPAGDVRAFSAVCTHLACTVQYRKDLQQIWCACHGGHYDLQGVPVAGPPPRPLERYEVALKGDEIWVSRGT